MLRPRLSLLLALLVLPLAAGAGAAAHQGLAVRELWLAPPEGTRVEHFVLEGESGAPLGTMRLLVGPDAEAAAAGMDGLRLEAETLFFAEKTRVLHSERLRRVPGERALLTLVWREVRPRSGRTLLVEGPLGGVLRSSETVGGDIVRREHADTAGAFLPLCLLEAARSGDELAGTHPVFEPLSSAFEELTLELFVDRSSGVEERVLELARAGERRGRYVFRAGSLVAFQLQAGGPRARPVSRDDYERMGAEHAAEEEPPEEAVVALRPGPGPR